MTYLDIDGTQAPTYGEHKAGMDISYKGVWGYAPLILSLANTKEVLYLVNRPGNLPSHTNAAPWIDKALDRVKPHTERVCLRGDTDFSLTTHFDRWAERADFLSIQFVTPADRHAGQDVEILTGRKAVYEAARAKNPERWSGSTRDWTPVAEVVLNPESSASAKEKQTRERSAA